MSSNPFSELFHEGSNAQDGTPEKQAGTSLDSSSTEADSQDSEETEPFSFEKVRAREMVEIARARDRFEHKKAARAAAGADGAGAAQKNVSGGQTADSGHKRGTVGLAFSGGGIRSATFNLGIIQGLARQNFLTQMDYLSTVSGGGYIGGWLTAWIKREGCGKVEQLLKQNAEQPGSGPKWRYLEPDPVRFLRNFSNYLAPRAGLVSTDTWALLASYFRNVMLNLTLLVASGAALLLVPLLVIWVTARLTPGTILSGPAVSDVMVRMALVSFFVALGVIAYSMASFASERAGAKAAQTPEQKHDAAAQTKPQWYVRLFARLRKTIQDKLARFRDTIQDKIVGRPGWSVVLPLVVTSLTLTPVLTGIDGSKLGSSVDGVLGYAMGRVAAHIATAVLWAAVGALGYGIVWTAADNAAALLWAAVNSLPEFLKAISQRAFGKLFKLAGMHGPKPVEFSAGWSLVATAGAGGLGGLLLFGIKTLLSNVAAATWDATATLNSNLYHRLGVELVLGPPLVLLAFTVISILHIGLLGTSFPDAKREWMARLCGMLVLVAAGCFLFTGIAIYGAITFKFLFTGDWAHTLWARALQALLAGGWVGTTAFGVIKGNRSNARPNSPDDTGLLLKLAPPVFILGLGLLLSAGVDACLSHGLKRTATAAVPTVQELQQIVRDTASAGGAGAFAQRFSQLMAGAAPPSWRASLSQASVQHWHVAAQYLGEERWRILYVFGALVLVAWALSRRLDVNEFSIHLLYRNRLTRCYLGASHRDRHPQGFTGFDMNDDMQLADLADQSPPSPPTSAVQGSPSTAQNSPLAPVQDPNACRYDGPYPLVCTTLNLVSGKDLAWQKRKARSFIYSPLFCGYDYFSFDEPKRALSTDKPKKGFSSNAYCRTPSFSGKGGPYLGTAMAISGAAASPNMGYHSSPALTFLMGVFNVRLGWWAGNTRHPSAWKLPGPESASYLALELFGRTDDEKRFVYLSDGGHFENLGLYELVRRHCPYIIISDASCDPKMSFSDLGNAIEKCRRDLGAEIDINISRLRLRHGEKLSKDHYAVGTITYKNPLPGADGNPSAPSVLLYIKSSLTGKEPEDVQSYASQHTAFPHDSTAEQFFDETRFESYRALGESIFESIVDEVTKFVESPEFKMESPEFKSSEFQRILGLVRSTRGDAATAAVALNPSIALNYVEVFFELLKTMKKPDKPPVRTGSIDMEEVPFGKMKLTFEAL